jgi:WD40 repeat protein
MARNKRGPTLPFFAFLILASPVLADQPAKVDVYGDPLPAGAIARLGTIRLRHSDSVALMASQPDGKVLVTVGNDGALCRWDVDSGRELGRFVLFHDRAMDPLGSGASAAGANWGMSHTSSSLPAVALSGDGKVLVSSGDSDSLQVWNAETGKVLRRVKRPEEGVGQMALSPDGTLLVVADGWSAVHIWDTSTGKALTREDQSPKDEVKRPGHGTYCTGLRFSPDGKTLAWLGRTQTDKELGKGTSEAKVFVRFLDARTGANRSRTEFFKLPRSSNSYAFFSPDSKVLAWLRGDSIQFIEVASGKELRQFGIASDETGTLVGLSPDGKNLLTRSAADRVLRIWDVGTGKELKKLGEPIRPSNAWTRAGTGRAWCLAVSPDGKLAALADEHLVRLLDLSTGNELPGNGHSSSVALVEFAPDGKSVTSWSVDGTFRIWESATSKQLQFVRAVQEGEYFALSPDGRTMAVAIDESTTALSDVPTGTELHRIKGPRNPFGTFDFSPDGKIFAVKGLDDKMLALALFDVPTGGVRHRIPIIVPPPPDGKIAIPKSDVAGLTFSPDGRLVAALINWHTVGFWDTTSGREHLQITAPNTRPIQGIVFRPDNRCVALDLGNGLISLRELATGKERRAFATQPNKEHESLMHESVPFKQFGAQSPAVLYSARPAAGVAFSPDSRMLGQSLADGTITLWGIALRKELAQLKGHRGYAPTLAFAPDGQTLASGSRDTTVLIWDVSAFGAKARPQAATVDAAARWQELISDDAAKAFDAICALADVPDKALPYLKQHARPAVTAEAATINRLIAELDSDQFDMRKKANDELAKLGEAAVPFVRKALEADPSPEARKRLQALLAKEPWRVPTGETLRSLRAIEVLEMIGTAEAKPVLQRLSKGTAGANVTRAAQEALERFKR